MRSMVEGPGDRAQKCNRNRAPFAQSGATHPPAMLVPLPRFGENQRRPVYSSPMRSAAMKASCGICTLPYSRMRFLPSFCFSSSFFFRLMSPP